MVIPQLLPARHLVVIVCFCLTAIGVGSAWADDDNAPPVPESVKGSGAIHKFEPTETAETITGDDHDESESTLAATADSSDADAADQVPVADESFDNESTERDEDNEASQSDLSVSRPEDQLSSSADHFYPTTDFRPQRSDADTPYGSETQFVPISQVVHHNPCPHCVDRDGKNGLIGDCGLRNGFGPCRNDCQCWQCPYNAPFNNVGPGEYAGPARTTRIPEYRLRTGDRISLTFLLAAMRSEGAYRLVVGDELLIESEADEELKRGTLEKGLVIQPDGTITLRLIGQVHAAGQSIAQLRDLLEERYTEFYPEPSIDVTPVNTGSAARQVREAISGTGGFDPQLIAQTITPSGEIRLPRVGSIQAQGLTLDELKEEINLRYDESVGGLEVEPSLDQQAPHNFFVLGEVASPGRFEMNTPTTVLGAIAMAGGHVPGANLRQVVVFRRGDNWELLSTLLDVRGAILGLRAHPADEIWIRDGDVIILPSAPIRLFDYFVRQVFTEGVYGIVPFNGFSIDLNNS